MIHYEESLLISASSRQVFNYIDDHKSFSSHMKKPSWMLGGGSMDISTDKDNGQKVGSHVRMRGKVFGLDLSLDEVITRREPPRVKEWTTIGTPRLIIIGYYRMKVNLLPQSQKTLLRVAIDYSLPEKNPWPGKIFGGLYASWCVRQMIRDTGRFFEGFSTSGI